MSKVDKQHKKGNKEALLMNSLLGWERAARSDIWTNQNREAVRWYQHDIIDNQPTTLTVTLRTWKCWSRYSWTQSKIKRFSTSNRLRACSLTSKVGELSLYLSTLPKLSFCYFLPSAKLLSMWTRNYWRWVLQCITLIKLLNQRSINRNFCGDKRKTQ